MILICLHACAGVCVGGGMRECYTMYICMNVCNYCYVLYTFIFIIIIINIVIVNTFSFFSVPHLYIYNKFLSLKSKEMDES